MNIRGAVLEGMIEHARLASPIEACGFLAGGGTVIDRLIRASNELNSPTGFSVPVAELFDLSRLLRAEGLSLRGIYHSHPATAPVPSRRDYECFFHPEVTCWIVSLATNPPDIRCFSWSKMDFDRIEYIVVS